MKRTDSVIAISNLSWLRPPELLLPPPPNRLAMFFFALGRDRFGCPRIVTSQRSCHKVFRAQREAAKMAEATTLALHRCRFVDFTPSPITALAFPPLPLPSPNKKPSSFGKQPVRFATLAVGHANGNIDLCEWTGAEGDLQSSQAWAIRTVTTPAVRMPAMHSII